MSETVIELDSVSFSYNRRHKAVDDVSGVFPRSSLTAIAGPNGAGKSTLLKLIAGLIRPHKGWIKIDPSLRNRIGYLPQASAVDRDFPLSVGQAVAAGLWYKTGGVEKIDTDSKKCISQALQHVGLEGFESREIGALSGGEFQRMLFARLIAQDAQILLLDEPFAAIDASTTAKLMQVIMDWHAQGKTIICVLHDLLLIHKYFPDSFVLAGKCMGRGHTHSLFEQKLLSFDLDMAELLAPSATHSSASEVQP